jgi:glycine/D-amino acid oxidase-like deaminating enzyme
MKVAVVGGGVVGRASAVELRRAGADVVLPLTVTLGD